MKTSLLHMDGPHPKPFDFVTTILLLNQISYKVNKGET